MSDPSRVSRARKCLISKSRLIEASGQFPCINIAAFLPCQIHALFRFKIVQGWRGHGKHLSIHPALIHERQPLLSEVVESLLDLTPIKTAGTSCPIAEDAHAARISEVKKCSSMPISFIIRDFFLDPYLALTAGGNKRSVTREQNSRCSQGTEGHLCPLVPLWLQPVKSVAIGELFESPSPWLCRNLLGRRAPQRAVHNRFPSTFFLC